MSALVYLSAAFMGITAGVALAAGINALGLPVRFAIAYGDKSMLSVTPWAAALGAAVFSTAEFGLFGIVLPGWATGAVWLAMGAYLGMSAVALTELLDVFNGPLRFLRRSELRWTAAGIAVGKAAFTLLWMAANGMLTTP